MRPGLTGLWQVSGRNDVDYRAADPSGRLVRPNWNLWYDLVIMARTFSAVLNRGGAY